MRALLTACVGLLTIGAAWAIPADEAAFLWEEANNHMAQARDAEAFRLAAGSYRELTENGVRNGHLFYNLGTAQTLGQQHDEAIESLLRAERFMGSSPEIRRNLQLAIEGKRGEDGAQAALPWYRPLLFWHYGLATRTRATVALAAFAAFWMLLSLRLLGLRAGTPPLIAVTVAVVIVFGSSAAMSLHQETQAEQAAAVRAQLMEEAS